MKNSHVIVLDNIDFDIDMNLLFDALRVKQDGRDSGILRAMAEEAVGIARPKALYKISFIETIDASSVIIDGVTFKSTILSSNLIKTHRAFPYVATCGTELEEWSQRYTDFLHQYWADTIKSFALGTALRAFMEDLESRYDPGTTSSMNPGSLDDWPITDQAKLFSLLGDTCGTIGVSLTESSLMLPLKSVSGLQFASDENFVSCKLCPRTNCPGRRAPFDEHLHRAKLGK